MKEPIKSTLPTEKEDIEVKETPDIAAGVKAVLKSFQNGLTQMTVTNCTKSYFNLNQVEGFDCPSCAWPDPRPDDRSSVAEYCENGAKAVAEEATAERANPDFFNKHSIEEMRTWSEWKLGKSGRITHPMVLREGATHYEPIAWEDAFEMIGDKLKSLDTPDEAVFYTSGRASNEAAFLYQLFARIYGTNNLPDCSNMCHESSGYALSRTIGIGKGTVNLEDLYIADVIMVIGQNPGTNHPRMMSALQKCKRNGGKIISVNPLIETGLRKFKNPQEVKGWIGKPTELSDMFLQVRVNGDNALLKGIILCLLNMEEENPGSAIDQEFIKEKTDGYDELVAHIKTFSLEELSELSGISVSDMQKTAEILASKKRIIICWAMGITQHTNGSDNVREIVNILLMRGAFGKPGAGACPIRGHSNVQGDRTMGVWEKLVPELGSRLKEHFQFDPPQEEGYDTVKSIEAMAAGKVKFYMSLGGNMLLAGPDTDVIAEGMQNCEMTVMVSTKPNRNHLITGKTALILPCLGRTEKDMKHNVHQFLSVENSMSIVHSSKGVLKPASEHLKSEPEIIARIAKATVDGQAKIDWLHMIEDYDNIRNAIEKCVVGFEDYNRRVRREGGFYLPNGPKEGRFDTENGKAHFSVTALAKIPLKSEEFLMTTLRSHDQFNTTIYAENDRYRGIYNGRRVVMMNREDIIKTGLRQGDYVDLVSNFGEKERIAPNFMVVNYNIPKRCVATYFPEANVLVPLGKTDPGSNIPASKSVVITIRKK